MGEVEVVGVERAVSVGGRWRWGGGLKEQCVGR